MVCTFVERRSRLWDGGYDSSLLIGHTVRRTAFTQCVPTSQATALFPSFGARAAAAPSRGYYRRVHCLRPSTTDVRASETDSLLFSFLSFIIIIIIFSTILLRARPKTDDGDKWVCACAFSPQSLYPTDHHWRLSRPCVCTCLYMRSYECACVLLNQLPCSRYRSAAVAVNLFVFARSCSRLTPSPSPTVYHG